MLRMNLDTDFDYQSLALKDDYEGPLSACFISAKANRGGRAAVLYLHGFVDYFFHPHLADQCLQHGYDFYALDLRKYGRALQSDQHPNYCRDLSEYFEEISLAISRICADSEVPISLLGHSTGGLIASLYAGKGDKRDSIHTLILNSPFLEFNLSPLMRLLLPPVAKLLGAIHPYANTSGVLLPYYPRSLHKDYDGEWDFNLDWKPLAGFPAYFRWLSAIRHGHKTLHRDIKLKIPVLVMHASRSFIPKHYSEAVKTADIVLNVEDIKRHGKKLGSQVELLEVENAMHDIFLSEKSVRKRAFSDLFNWLAQQNRVNQ